MQIHHGQLYAPVCPATYFHLHHSKYNALRKVSYREEDTPQASCYVQQTTAWLQESGGSFHYPNCHILCQVFTRLNTSILRDSCKRHPEKSTVYWYINSGSLSNEISSTSSAICQIESRLIKIYGCEQWSPSLQIQDTLYKGWYGKKTIRVKDDPPPKNK